MASSPSEKSPGSRARGIRIGVLLAAIGVTLGVWALTWQPGAAAEAPTIVFVVLDTVRSDHLSACGYERPTSPVLDELVRDGAALSCDAYAPGDWTLPSHASYFTGLTVPEHGAQAIVPTPEAPRSNNIQPLRDDLPTVAEQLWEEGYQTVMVAGNPLLVSGSGLGRGFTYKDVAQEMTPTSEVAEVEKFYAGAREPDRPLFLMVNLFDAHRPYLAVPPGIDWVPAHPGVIDFAYSEGCPEDDIWRRYTRGEMGEEEARDVLADITDRYDWGTFRADEKLAKILALVRERESRPLRLVITSDHGEFLGEHGLLDHGLQTWEPNQRVPLLYHSDEGPLALPEGPISALVSYELVRHGRLPDPLPKVEAVAQQGTVQAWCSDGATGTERWATRWDGEEKATLRGDGLFVVDLENDPDELDPRTVRTHRHEESLRALGAAADEAWQQEQMEGADQMMETLKSLGYVD